MATPFEDILFIIEKSQIDDLPSILASLLKTEKYHLALVKSNICGFYPPSLPLLKIILETLSKRFEKVYLGDTPSTLYSVQSRLESLGLTSLIEEIGPNVEAVDFSKMSDTVKVTVPYPHALNHYPIPKVVLEADTLVNVAKIGSHQSTKVTAALKNLFGLVASKMKYFKYHPLGMDRVIADLAQIIKPDINIVETRDKIVVSPDSLIADIASSLITGFNPLEVKHFYLVARDENRELEKLVNEVSKCLKKSA